MGEEPKERRAAIDKDKPRRPPKVATEFPIDFVCFFLPKNPMNEDQKKQQAVPVTPIVHIIPPQHLPTQQTV